MARLAGKQAVVLGAAGAGNMAQVIARRFACFRCGRAGGNCAFEQVRAGPGPRMHDPA